LIKTFVMWRFFRAVIPAKAGIHLRSAYGQMDSRFRGNDGREERRFAIELKENSASCNTAP
jgi:hypothetical protein